jgi:integrase/recombinase XerD
MSDFSWQAYLYVAQNPLAQAWLILQRNLRLAPNTIAAYARALEDFLAFCARDLTEPLEVSRVHIAAYVNDLATRPHPRCSSCPSSPPTIGLANATMQQRLTAIRLFYDYLVEQGLRIDNPVGRGRYTPGRCFGGIRERGLLPRYQKLPWIPTDDQWRALLDATRSEPLRNRLMFAFAYDAGLRREELCALETSVFDPAHRLIRIRAETTKNRRERMVPYSSVAADLFTAYLQERRTLSSARGRLFLSVSRRNLAQPISIWTWSKIVAGIAERACVPEFTTHTLRHLCLTDLARAGWDLHEIATFAGHRSIQTTLRYIHLSGRDLAKKLERGMADIHQRRVALIGEVLK